VGVGAAGEVGSSQPLVLNATGSRDLDGLSAVPFKYTWACVDTASGAACTNAGNGQVVDMALLWQGGAEAGNAGAVVSLPAGTLRAGMYSFTVIVSKGVAGGLLPRVLRSSRFVGDWKWRCVCDGRAGLYTRLCCSPAAVPYSAVAPHTVQA